MAWIVVGLLALSACKSGTPAPAGEESPVEPSATAEEASTPTEPAPIEEPAAAPFIYTLF